MEKITTAKKIRRFERDSAAASSFQKKKRRGIITITIAKNPAGWYIFGLTCLCFKIIFSNIVPAPNPIDPKNGTA